MSDDIKDALAKAVATVGPDTMGDTVMAILDVLHLMNGLEPSKAMRERAKLPRVIKDA